MEIARLSRRLLRLLAAFGCVVAVTFVAHGLSHVNATTVGFAYLLVVLAIAIIWGFVEAALSSILASVLFNFYFFPPFGTLTIEDPQNWVALFTFLATSLIASRLSAMAKRRTLEALARQQDLERLYALSRAILLIDRSELFADQLLGKLKEIFALEGAVLYDRRTGNCYRAAPARPEDSEDERADDRLRDAAVHGVSFPEPERRRFILAVRLGTEPIASLALQGEQIPDSLLEGIANLVAIGLERARAQDLAQQVEAARQSEQLRTTLIDAMAHEFKTPLTLIKGVTTALLANPENLTASTTEQLTIADEEADHLRELIENAVDMARLDTAKIEVNREPVEVREIVDEVVATMQNELRERSLEIFCDKRIPTVAVDRTLMRLAIKQLVDNALKYSPPDEAVMVRVSANAQLEIDVTDHGAGIPEKEQNQIFERFYRSASIKDQIPGSGLGLSIAHRVVHAHGGELRVISRPGETTFRIELPLAQTGDRT